MGNQGLKSSVGVACPPFTRGPYSWDQDLTIDAHFQRSPNRYYLEEFFKQRVGINGDIDQVYTIEVARSLTKDFELLGTNAVTACSGFSATDAAMTLTTTAADDDQVILLPHLDTDQTAWTGIKWGTENQTIWEATIKTPAAITTLLLWAGLKLTNTPVIATDDDQVMFRFSTDDSNTTWRVITSIAGTDVNTSSGIAVAAATIYRFRIVIDSNRCAQFFINEALVYTSTPLTNDVDLIPYIGIQNLGAGARILTVFYEKISRTLFE